MRSFRLCAVMGILCVAISGHAQNAAKPAAAEMSLEDLRGYMVALHIKEADESGVRVQMEKEKTQLPPWWPPAVTEEMMKRMLGVDIAAIEYPYVKACVNSADLHALQALFETPEGQAYARKATGTMVAKEAGGATPLAAHQQVEKEDQGLPPKALNRLPQAQRERVVRLLNGGVMDCMSEGFHYGSDAVTEARTQAVHQLIGEHRAELQAAKQKYEAAAPAPPAK